MRPQSKSGTRDEKRTDTVQRVAKIYERVLAVHDVGDDDDFFVLGGSSLSAITLLDTIATEMGVRVPVGDFYTATTVALLARVVDTLAPYQGRDRV